MNAQNANITAPPDETATTTGHHRRLRDRLRSAARSRPFASRTTETEPSASSAQAPELQFIQSLTNYDWTAAFTPPSAFPSVNGPSTHTTPSKKDESSHRRTRSTKMDQEVALAKAARDVGGLSCIKVGAGWQKYVHFNGSVYYYHPDAKIITTDDIERDTQREAVEDLGYDTVDILEEDGLFKYIPGRRETQVLVSSAADDYKARVVFLGHDESRYCLFPNNGPDVIEETNTYTYWCHVEEYPMHLGKLPNSAEEEFISALTYGASVSILGDKENLFPYTDSQIEKMMRIYRHQKIISKSNQRAVPSLNFHIGRVLAQVQSTRQWYRRYDSNGIPQSGFTLRRKPTKHKSTWQFEMTQFFLALVLLGAHRMYFQRLKKIRTGKSVYLPDFREVLRQFLAEWTDSNLLATVFVGANIAFQQLPNINNLQRTASLSSAIFALLSVATGVHHVWQHRAKVSADINEAVRYLNHAGDWEAVEDDTPPTNILGISAFLAVPFSALLWSILSFTIALAILCIQSTGPRGLILVTVVLGALGLLCLATLLFFRHIWHPSREKSAFGAILRTKFHGWMSSFGRNCRRSVVRNDGKLA